MSRPSAHYVFYAVLRGDLRSAVIPVQLWAGDVIDEPNGVAASSGVLAGAIRRRLLLSLAMKPWLPKKPDQHEEWANQGWANRLIAAHAAARHRTIDELPWDDELDGPYKDVDLAALTQRLARGPGLYPSVTSMCQRRLSAR